MRKNRTGNHNYRRKNYLLSKKRWFILQISGISAAFTVLLYMFLPPVPGFAGLAGVYLKTLVCLSVLTFAIFIIDKKLSYGATTRIPNSFLYGLAFVSGGISSFVARTISRHKISDNHGEPGKNYRTKFGLIEQSGFVLHFLLFMLLVY